MMQIARATNLTVFRRNNDASGEYEESIAWEVQSAISLDAARRCGEKKDTGAGSGITPVVTPPRKDRCAKCGGNHPTNKHLDPKEFQKKKERDEDRRQKRCFDCKKPWTPGHKCADGEKKKPQNNNMVLSDNDDPNPEVPGDPDESTGSQFADWLFNKPEVNVTEGSNPVKRLIYTPININGIPGMALVDSGATDMFISRRFVEENNVKMEAISGEIIGGGGKKLADRIGDVMDMPESRDLVIGLSDFDAFGYKLTGVPVKKPEPMGSEMADEVSEGAVDRVDGLKPCDLSDQVVEAMRKNENLPTNATTYRTRMNAV